MVFNVPGELSNQLPDETVASVQHIIDCHPYLSWLGLEMKALMSGRAHLVVPYKEKLANPGGPKGLHGGVSSAVLDAAGAVAVASTFDDPTEALGQGSLSTTDLNVSYLRPATDDLFIEAETVNVGQSNAVARITARLPRSDSTNHEPEAVVGRGTYRLF
ncbi:PaaI family thioesterase [Haloarchaeobius sp. TZWSO28]|uniref:PaaI family thioesterase n=1 Tax=Haloarchaeobius sp. TZWSO28 TaxID=3446119 RepID=UPI003EB723F0